MKSGVTRGDDPSEPYQARRERIRKLILRVTAAVIALSIVPYLVGASYGSVLLIITPVLSCWLIVFALCRIRQDVYREGNLKDLHPNTGERGVTAELGAITYIVMLGVLAFLHFLFISASEFNYV